MSNNISVQNPFQSSAVLQRVLSYFSPPSTQYSQILCSFSPCDCHHPSLPPSLTEGISLYCAPYLGSESSASDAGELVAYIASSSAWTLGRMPFGFEMWLSSRYGPSPPPVLPSQSPRYRRPPAVEAMSMAYEVEESVCSSQIELLAGGKVTFKVHLRLKNVSRMS